MPGEAVINQPQKPIQTPQPKTIQRPVEVKKHVQQPVEQKKQEIVKQKEVIQKPAPKPKKPRYNPNSPQMLKYKSGLRATLFSKFAVGSIQGSGSCDIEFSVDNTGKLINRKFTRESSNKALNDTVYYMLMSVPRYNPPPSDYNGETIRMNFKIDNGDYEISIH